MAKTWAAKKVGFKFKWLRKIGASWLEDNGGGQEVARTYMAHSFGGTDDEYLTHMSDETVANLRAGLEKFRDRLIADGVLR